MNPATRPRSQRDAAKLLVVDPVGDALQDRTFETLPQLFEPADVLVVNDSATLPASLHGRDDEGRAIEFRLTEPLNDTQARGVLFGPGTWRMRTEDRLAPPRLSVGDRLHFGELTATVLAVHSARRVDLRFEANHGWASLYREGRPIQYSYLAEDLDLWSVQTVYAGRPWSVEMPSAGHPFTWKILLELRRRGVSIASLTHAAGLSSTGDPDLDGQLPFPERYELPEATVRAIEGARDRNGRVVAVGTTVVRAIEGNAQAHDGRLQAGTFTTDLVIEPGFAPRWVDGLVTGIHEPSESHYRLLGAFASRRMLDRAWQYAHANGYQVHEFGDTSIILPSSAARHRAA